MNQLLGTELFDRFLLAQATIRTDVTYEIDGHYNDGFYPEEIRKQELPDGAQYQTFARLRPVFFSLIRGKHTLVGFQFSFLLSPENQQRTLARAQTAFSDEDISGMYIHIRYRDGVLQATTGISYVNFSLDRSLEEAWDKYVQQFFAQSGLEYTIL